MEFLQSALDLFLNLDDHLKQFVDQNGAWTYGLLFLIIFLETGVVFTPFLPGDSLIFATGALAAVGALNVWLLLGLMIVAAVLGDAANYWIGKYFGRWLLARNWRYFNHKHLARTHEFFERYGGKTIVIARFVPIVRTFAPFVAGMGAMSYGKFAAYNVFGAVLWVTVCLGAGYIFGQVPFVKKHFELVIVAIILLSITPAVFEFMRARMRKRADALQPPPPGAAAETPADH
ncbi:MAG: DedA family protein [Phycisphaerae bacterium]|nr:DedA family protein [Phycisphaerae bacterium]MCZ2399095.1 DedA family protein [Phycisphaerae bacterium]